MGMFDSLIINCPECNNNLEFCSKSGECYLSCYTKENLTPEVAIGMNGDIVKCKFCNNNFKLECKFKKIDIELIKTIEKEDYRGN